MCNSLSHLATHVAWWKGGRKDPLPLYRVTLWEHVAPTHRLTI